MKHHNSIFRVPDHGELKAAIEEAKRKSVYRFLPPMATYEPKAVSAPVSPAVDPPFEKSAERAEETFEKEPAEEKHEEEQRLDYPEAAHLEGKSKVDALAGLILQDGSIDKDLKRKRLNYLIALNARNHWTSDEEVRHVVEVSINSLK